MFPLFGFITTITAAQLVAHGIGDYLLQSNWMAVRKTSSWLVASVHGITYGIPFVLIFAPSPAAVAMIVLTHIIIDRLGLARYVCWLKCWLAPERPRPWSECRTTGFPPETPEYLAKMLLTIVDNLIHVLINAWALAML